MDLLLQCIGGGCYLLHKAFMAFSERILRKGDQATSRKWRITAWSVYLLGLPPWVILFVQEKNWIAASVEACGLPAMIMGLWVSLRHDEEVQVPRWIDRMALVSIPVGIAYSLYDFGGLSRVTQWLEIALVLGFLIGTYLLAKRRRAGYLWYVLMHVACGALMYIQGYAWLGLQQGASLLFILDACIVSGKGGKLYDS